MTINNINTLQSQIGVCGLGLRNEHKQQIILTQPTAIHFLEVAPENYMRATHRELQLFRAYTEKYPVLCHSVSLSLGGIKPIDTSFVQELKLFLKTYSIPLYSDHLSYSGDAKGHLYNLLPIPFTEDAVYYLAKRIIQVQDILEQQIAIENISYYTSLPGELSEIEFMHAVLTEANCLMLLDVNNLYVNQINHGTDAIKFLNQLPQNRIAYIHIAGHLQLSPELLVDTHGAKIIDPVWDLLAYAYRRFGIVPTLLERDHDIPSLEDLLDELNMIQTVQKHYQQESSRRV